MIARRGPQGSLSPKFSVISTIISEVMAYCTNYWRAPFFFERERYRERDRERGRSETPCKTKRISHRGGYVISVITLGDGVTIRLLGGGLDFLGNKNVCGELNKWPQGMVE